MEESMSYTKEYDPNQYREIEEHISQIMAMEPGEQLWYKDLEPNVLSRLRWLIYNYLHHMKLKPMYSIKTLRGSDLLIQRRGCKTMPILERASRHEESHIEELVKRFLSLDKKEFTARLEQLPLTEEEKANVRKRWEEVMA